MSHDNLGYCVPIRLFFSKHISSRKSFFFLIDELREIPLAASHPMTHFHSLNIHICALTGVKITEYDKPSFRTGRINSHLIKLYMKILANSSRGESSALI